MDKSGSSCKCIVYVPWCFVLEDSGRHPADASSWGVHGQLDKQQPPSSPLCDIFERSSPWAAPDAHRLTHSTAPCLPVQKLTVQRALWQVPHRYKKTLRRPLYWHQGKSVFRALGAIFTVNSSGRIWALSARQAEHPCESILGRNTETGKNGARRRKSRGFFQTSLKTESFQLAWTNRPPFKRWSH